MRAVIFDFDGVLVNSEPLHFRAMRDSLIPEGIVIDSTEYLRNYVAYDDRSAIRLALEQHGHPCDPVRVEIVADRKARMFAEMKSGIPFFPGARELVREPAAARCRWPSRPAPATPRSRTSWTRAACATPSPPSWARTTWSAPSRDPEPYLEALRQLQDRSRPGLEAGDCVAIEDTPPGIAAARAAGMTVVGVAHTYDAARARLRPPRPAVAAPGGRGRAARARRAPGMTSRHVDPDQAKRHAEHRFDFNRKGLGRPRGPAPRRRGRHRAPR